MSVENVKYAVWSCDLCGKSKETDDMEAPQNWCSITTEAFHENSVTGDGSEKAHLCTECGVLVESVLKLRSEDHTQDEKWEQAEEIREIITLF